MKATITVHIPDGAVVSVKEDEEVSETTVLAKVDEEEETTPVDLAALLQTKPSNISKHLTVKIGETVVEGDTIASKKSLISSVSVKSPLSGTLVSIDLTSGSLVFRTKQSIPKKVVSPVKGKIKSIKSKIIEIEADALIFEVEKGKGEKVRGILRFIDAGEVGVMGGKAEDLEGSIAMMGSITDAAIVKYDVMGVKGLILEKVPSFEVSLPYVLVEKGVFQKLTHASGKIAVLDPAEKRVYFLD